LSRDIFQSLFLFPKYEVSEACNIQVNIILTQKRHSTRTAIKKFIKKEVKSLPALTFKERKKKRDHGFPFAPSLFEIHTLLELCGGNPRELMLSVSEAIGVWYRVVTDLVGCTGV
jgi:hypothetical protein